MIINLHNLTIMYYNNENNYINNYNYFRNNLMTFYDNLMELDSGLNKFENKIMQSLVENEIKYEGYIARQNADIQQAAKLQDIKIPSSLDINLIPGLSNEIIDSTNEV